MVRPWLGGTRARSVLAGKSRAKRGNESANERPDWEPGPWKARGRCIMSEKNETREPKMPRSKSVRVMLVDDEVGYLNVLANRLGKRGLSVVKCKSGGDAIRTLRKQDFDVAVLDLKMEDMDGIEVLKIFRQMDPLLMVVMLTGHGSEKAAREGLLSGAFDYLTKPCEIDELTAKIREAFEARRDKARKHDT